MNYEAFKNRVNALIDKAGGNLAVKFSTEDGRHKASFSDGTIITGNASSLSLSVRWGSGHQAMARV